MVLYNPATGGYCKDIGDGAGDPCMVLYNPATGGYCTDIGDGAGDPWFSITGLCLNGLSCFGS